MKDVELDGGGPGLLHEGRMLGPAFARDAVQACDDGNAGAVRGLPKQLQIGPWADAAVLDGWEVVEGLAEALGASAGQPLESGALLPDLLLEQREEDDGGSPAILQPPYPVERA